MTASSLRLPSQPKRSPGGTTSASRRLPRLRHFSSLPKWSLTTMSLRPASFRLATTFDPMNPAPPVTNSIPTPLDFDSLPFAPECRAVQRSVQGLGYACARHERWTGGDRRDNGSQPLRDAPLDMNTDSEN